MEERTCGDCADYNVKLKHCASAVGDFCGSYRKEDEIACLYYWPNVKDSRRENENIKRRKTMFSWVKYLKYYKLLAQWKDVAKVFKEENGTDKPWYVSRRFFGAALTFIGIVVYTVFNVSLDQDSLNLLANNLETIGKQAEVIIPAIASIYGIITSIVGSIMKSKKEEPK